MTASVPTRCGEDVITLHRARIVHRTRRLSDAVREVVVEFVPEPGRRARGRSRRRPQGRPLPCVRERRAVCRDDEGPISASSLRNRSSGLRGASSRPRTLPSATAGSRWLLQRLHCSTCAQARPIPDGEIRRECATRSPVIRRPGDRPGDRAFSSRFRYVGSDTDGKRVGTEFLAVASFRRGTGLRGEVAGDRWRGRGPRAAASRSTGSAGAHRVRLRGHRRRGSASPTTRPRVRREPRGPSDDTV